MIIILIHIPEVVKLAFPTRQAAAACLQLHTHRCPAASSTRLLNLSLLLKCTFTQLSEEVKRVGAGLGMLCAHSAQTGRRAAWCRRPPDDVVDAVGAQPGLQPLLQHVPAPLRLPLPLKVVVPGEHVVYVRVQGFHDVLEGPKRNELRAAQVLLHPVDRL